MRSPATFKRVGNAGEFLTSVFEILMVSLPSSTGSEIPRGLSPWCLLRTGLPLRMPWGSRSLELTPGNFPESHDHPKTTRRSLGRGQVAFLAENRLRSQYEPAASSGPAKGFWHPSATPTVSAAPANPGSQRPARLQRYDPTIHEAWLPPCAARMSGVVLPPSATPRPRPQRGGQGAQESGRRGIHRRTRSPS